LLKLTHSAASSQIELESTVTTSTSGPRMTFYRNSSSPADNDTLGRIIFKGNTSTADAVYADIIGKIIESTEGQSDGGLIFRATVNGSDNQDIMRVEAGTSSVKQVVPGGNNTILLGNSNTAWKQSYVREYYGYDGSSFNGGVSSANNSGNSVFTTSTGTDVTTNAPANLTFSSAGGIVTLADIQAAPSDSRYKENVVDLDKGLTFLESLPSAKTFDFKDSVKEIGVKEPKKNELGFLAQDVEKILPDVITTVKDDNSEFGEFKTINYPEFDKTLIYSLVNAVKELSAKVKELEAK